MCILFSGTFSIYCIRKVKWSCTWSNPAHTQSTTVQEEKWVWLAYLILSWLADCSGLKWEALVLGGTETTQIITAMLMKVSISELDYVPAIMPGIWHNFICVKCFFCHNLFQMRKLSPRKRKQFVIVSDLAYFRYGIFSSPRTQVKCRHNSHSMEKQDREFEKA